MVQRWRSGLMTSFGGTCCEEEEVHAAILPPRCILEQLGQGFMLMARFFRDAFPSRHSGSAQNLCTSNAIHMAYLDACIPNVYTMALANHPASYCEGRVGCFWGNNNLGKTTQSSSDHEDHSRQSNRCNDLTDGELQLSLPLTWPRLVFPCSYCKEDMPNFGWLFEDFNT